MTTQQEIDAIIGKYEPDAWLWKNEPHGETVCSGPGDPHPAEAVPHRTDETVRAMLAEALAEKAQEPVVWQYRSQPVNEEWWSIWQDCSKEYAADRELNSTSRGWRYEVRALYTTPPTTEAAAQAAAQAMREECAEFFEQKACTYAAMYGYEDMGALSFGRGPNANAMTEYYSSLLEHAEAIRSLPLETSALEAFGMKVLREDRRVLGYSAYAVSVDDNQIRAIVKRVIEGEKA
jgi:hypothetical protein